MASARTEFDPRIIERHVDGLLRKSNAILVGAVVLGVMLGAAFGATPLTSLANWPIPREFGFGTMLLGGILGGIIGYVVGDTRSFLYKLQAQIALAQVKTAQDSEAVLSILRGVAAATKAPTPKPAPQAAPPAPAAAESAPLPEPPAPPQQVAPAPPPVPVSPPPPTQPEPPSAPPRLAAVGESSPPPPLVSPPLSS